MAFGRHICVTELIQFDFFGRGASGGNLSYRTFYRAELYSANLPVVRFMKMLANFSSHLNDIVASSKTKGINF